MVSHTHPELGRTSHNSLTNLEAQCFVAVVCDQCSCTRARAFPFDEKNLEVQASSCATCVERSIEQSATMLNLEV